jgi:hypothetical protein
MTTRPATVELLAANNTNEHPRSASSSPATKPTKLLELAEACLANNQTDKAMAYVKKLQHYPLTQQDRRRLCTLLSQPTSEAQAVEMLSPVTKNSPPEMVEGAVLGGLLYFSNSTRVMLHACKAVSMCLSGRGIDDARRRVKEQIGREGGIARILACVRARNDLVVLVAVCFDALRVLVEDNDLTTQLLVKANGLDLVMTTAIANIHNRDSAILVSCLALLNCLAATKSVQDWLVRYDLSSFLLKCINNVTTAIVVKYGLALLHPLLTTSEKSRQQFCDKKGVRAIVACLHTFGHDRRVARTSFSLLCDFVSNDSERAALANVGAARLVAEGVRAHVRHGEVVQAGVVLLRGTQQCEYALSALFLFPPFHV